MAGSTGIKWTDSTWSSWWGCTKVGPACDHCYAEGVDKRTGENHWGHGAPRKRISEKTRNDPYRWNKKADEFFAIHGRRQRVFTLSMGDLFDNEVPDEWRIEHMKTMAACDKLEWQICTKRISNLPKMSSDLWGPISGGISATNLVGVGFNHVDRWHRWPKNIGVLITVVTQAEADRDVPRLLRYKEEGGIPWVGISYEPAQEYVDFSNWMGFPEFESYKNLDWIIHGGKSGGQWNDRPYDIEWARMTRDACLGMGTTAFFMKQVAGFRPTDDMIPDDLMIRQWPKGH